MCAKSCPAHDVQDYLHELKTPAVDVYAKSTLDRTFTVAYNSTRHVFLPASDPYMRSETTLHCRTSHKKQHTKSSRL